MREVWKEIQSGQEWIVDADLRDFSGSVDHAKLLTLVAQRIADGRVLRLIEAMLKAGSYGHGRLFPSERGTPQGGVTTPRTQKVTSSLSGGCGFCGNRVHIDVCRIRLYVYGRCHAPASSRKPTASIERAICCCASINSPLRSSSWRGTAPYRRVKPIATSSKHSN